MAICAGSRIGNWQLIGEKPLGEGGNSVVWRAKNDSGIEIAIKFLFEHHFTTSRYSRFVSEIDFLNRIGNRKGVVPLVDSYLPATPTKKDRPWLAMQLAIPVVKTFHENGIDLKRSVEFIQSIAETLSQIHKEGAAHRDVKPDNLFYLQDVPAIGDFGLVDYPGKESVTSNKERMGPLFYIAPEMMSDTDTVDPRPADVYSLAKTLWVFSAGQNYPLPGELRIDIPQARLSSYVRSERAPMLDLLLERSTRHNPSERPSMEEFAKELSSWLTPRSSNTLTDMSHLSALFRPIIIRSETSKSVYKAKADRTKVITQQFHDFLKDISRPITEITGFPTGINGGGGLSEAFPYPAKARTSSACICQESIALRCETYLAGAKGTLFICGFVIFADVEGRMTLTGGYVINPPSGKPLPVYKETHEFMVQTAEEANAVTTLLNNLRNKLPDALEKFARVANQ
jgi:serine/threonine protein kinase